MGKSNFMFQIEGTMEGFEHQLRTYHRPDVICTKEPEKIVLHDTRTDTVLTFQKEEEKYVITMSNNNYRYEIFKSETGETTVVYTGAVNAMWQQNLLPQIDYRKGTLLGKYEEEESYLSIADYMERRQKTIGDSNQQDNRSWKVNDVFKNDIPYLKKAFRSENANITDYRKRHQGRSPKGYKGKY